MTDNNGQTTLLHGAQLTGAKELIPAIREASRLSIRRGLMTIAFDWAIILGVAALAIQWPNPFVWFAAAVVIAGRQHGLLVLMHEATHYRIVPDRKWNDRISNWFLAWPLFVTTEGFRRDHLPHHFNLFTEADPEWSRKQKRPEFQFPLSRSAFLVLLAKDILGFSVFKMLKMLANFSATPEQVSSQERPPLLRRIERPAYYALVGGIVVYTNLIVPLLLLWLLPAFTLLFAILRIRNVAEHSNVGVRHDLEMSRNVVSPTALERLILAPHHVGLHLVHHLYPSVPFYNLPRVHEALSSIPEYASDSLSVATYFGWRRSSVFRDISIRRENEFSLLKEQREELNRRVAVSEVIAVS